MTEALTIQGRVVDAVGVEQVRALVDAHPEWSRWRLSRRLAEQWDWRNGVGLLKDMAVRALLLKLEQRGLIQLPARRRRCPNRMRLAPMVQGAVRVEAIAGVLASLQPLRIEEVSRQPEGRRMLGQLLHQHHYLSYTSPVGENLQYLAWDRHGRVLAGSVFGAGAWKCGPRDQFIGWDPPARQARLSWICNQNRFLILPSVRVPHLASHLLHRWSRRLASDWQAKYGHRVCLVETFVEAGRFGGTCYRAAGWIHVGTTQGRSRQDTHRQLQVPRKEIYLCPLQPQYRQALTMAAVAPPLPAACLK